MPRKTPLEGLVIVLKACGILAFVFIFFLWFFRAIDFIWNKVERVRTRYSRAKEL
jgi:hypothetical protein